MPKHWPQHDWDWLSWAEFSYPFNMSWNPAASVPCGFTAEGLPVGLQIVGRRFDDLGVLQASAAFEQIAALGGQAAEARLTGAHARADQRLPAGLSGAVLHRQPDQRRIHLRRDHRGSLDRRASAGWRAQVAIYSLVVMMVALWAGSFVLAFFGITLAALRVAGGVVVALTAWQLLNRPEHREARKRSRPRLPPDSDDIALFPHDHSHHHWSGHDGGCRGAQRQPAARRLRRSRVLSSA